jgi:hypothetical protein
MWSIGGVAARATVEAPVAAAAATAAIRGSDAISVKYRA